MILSSKLTKIFGGVTITLLLGLAFLWWQNNGLNNSLGESQARNEQLVESMKANERAVERLLIDAALQDRIIEERSSKRAEDARQIQSLQERLNEERVKNKELADCWDVELGDYVDSLRQQSSRRGESGASEGATGSAP